MSNSYPHLNLKPILGPDYQWTTQNVIDELHFHLETFTDENNFKKYEKQAKELIYRIPVYRPVPSFIIDKTDLTCRILTELASYNEESREDILKTSVARIFENVNRRYFLQSVKYLLKVELRG